MNSRYRLAIALTLVLASSASPAQVSGTPYVDLRKVSPKLLAMGQAGALKPSRSWVDARGTAFARFNQTHEGFRVFGAGLVASESPEGRVATLGRALESRIELTGRPLVSEEQARRISHRELLPRGPYAALPSVELVVFPTRFTTGLRPKVDAKGGVSWDRENSVLAPRPAGSHVWAYEVVSFLNNREDGVQQQHVIVDARTGNVLRKWNSATSIRPRSPERLVRTYGDLERANAPLQIAPAFLSPSPQIAGPLQNAGPLSVGATPAVGTGHSQYSGDVQIGTAASPNGGYDLTDLSRANSPNKVWLTRGIVTNYFDILKPGFVIVPYAMSNQAGSLDDVWGDGQNYLAPAPNHPNDFYTPEVFHWGDANGQTAAVDAHFAAASTYDMYRNVLGRVGLDGADEGIVSVVHYNYLYDNAAWIDDFQMMVYGDGSYPFGGVKSLTSLEIGGHEMSHGVMAATANLDYIGESGGLNEANSDMFAQAVVAYSKRVSGDPLDRIPAVDLDWGIGRQVSPDGTPFRFMFKPSLDGQSPDAWFYGMDMLDVHYTSGAGNRFFYFLSTGADGNPASDSYSPYLPGGMNGIGLDKATHIWYKAVTEQFTNTTNYHQARSGALNAAAALYGASSAEYAAVENAFAAINVGPAHGRAAPPVVTFPDDLIALDSPISVLTEDSFFSGVFSKTPVVPAGGVLALKVNVANTSDPSVNWKAGIGPGFFSPLDTPLNVTASNGSFDDQGLFHAPVVAPVWCGVRAFSKVDPLQFAATMVYTAHMDADGDSEQDALDAGMLALVWHLKKPVVDEISPFPDPESAGSVDDVSVQLWMEAFNNAFAR
ncbi:MAG TPA: M4 family metallopeptidase [Myxococcales bacterium]|nr:M4 family metallopeptidase [Myxococcales bacterium]